MTIINIYLEERAARYTKYKKYKQPNNSLLFWENTLSLDWIQAKLKST